MLVDFFAPELEDDLKGLSEETEQFSKTIVKAIGAENLQKAEKQKLNAEVILGHARLEKFCQDMATNAATLARKKRMS
jgi:hypothetical protein